MHLIELNGVLGMRFIACSELTEALRDDDDVVKICFIKNYYDETYQQIKKRHIIQGIIII